MKMGTALFWGLLLILIGFSLIFKIVFNVDFPLLKIIVAFFFIYIGLRILFGSAGFSNKKGIGNEENVIFGERKYSTTGKSKEYNVVFGSGVYDFRDVDLSRGEKRLRISVVFGGAEVKLSRETPVRIRVDAVFSGVNLPDGNSAVFGNSTYESPGFNSDIPHLELKLEAVFGGIDVKLY